MVIIGNKEKAKEYARMGGDLWTFAAIFISDVLEGDECRQHNVKMMLALLNLIGATEHALCQKQDLL